MTIFDSGFLFVTEAFNCTGTGFAAVVLDKLLFDVALTALAAAGLTALAALSAPRLIGVATLTTAGRALVLATATVTGALRLAALTGAGLAAVFTAAFGAALAVAALTAGFALGLRDALEAAALDTFFSVFAGFFISTRHRIKAKSYLHSNGQIDRIAPNCPELPRINLSIRLTVFGIVSPKINAAILNESFRV
ncbi:MAG TPA: hypothetical protein VGM52_06155 [Herbaspirillum sp.]